MKKILLLLFCLLLMTACDDPVKDAKARAIDAKTEATRVETRLKELEKDAEIEDQIETTAASQPYRILFKKVGWTWLTVNSVLSLSVLTLSLCIAALGFSIGFAKKSLLYPWRVNIDKATRTWPVLIAPDKDGWVIVNLETGERTRSNRESPPHLPSLVASARVRVAGELAAAAEEMAKSTGDGNAGAAVAAMAYSIPLLSGDILGEEFD